MLIYIDKYHVNDDVYSPDIDIKYDDKVKFVKKENPETVLKHVYQRKYYIYKHKLSCRGNVQTSIIFDRDIYEISGYYYL